MGRPVIDLTGKVFGAWTVKERAVPPTDKCNNARWVCICSCGFMRVLPSRHLTDSRQMKGCHRCGVRLICGTSNDLTGKVIGGWTVISRAGTRGTQKNRKSVWRCKCYIGHEQQLTSADLRSSASCRSCDGKDTPVGSNGTVYLSPSDVARLYSPMVYMWRLASEWLYIGSTALGLSRVFDARHESSHESRKLGAELHLITCKTAVEAQALEQDLIYALKPRYNIVIPDR